MQLFHNALPFFLKLWRCFGTPGASLNGSSPDLKLLFLPPKENRKMKRMMTMIAAMALLAAGSVMAPSTADAGGAFSISVGGFSYSNVPAYRSYRYPTYGRYRTPVSRPPVGFYSPGFYRGPVVVPRYGSPYGSSRYYDRGRYSRRCR